MNETDKMLADMLASLEKTKKQTNEQPSDAINNKESEIKNLLKELTLAFGGVTDEFVFVNTDKNNSDRGFYISNHPVTQKEFEYVMGVNPSWFKKDNLMVKKQQRNLIEKLSDTKRHPVEFVSWFDAIYYCNKRSIMENLTPVYQLDGKESNIDNWNYVPFQGKTLGNSALVANLKADGYRLPTLEEWRTAAKADGNCTYSGSNYIKDVAWYSVNSKDITHPVMEKNPNAYGIYDMSGNVWEWCWDFGDNTHQNIAGGSYNDLCDNCKISKASSRDSYVQVASIGFRVVRTAK